MPEIRPSDVDPLIGAARLRSRLAGGHDLNIVSLCCVQHLGRSRGAEGMVGIGAAILVAGFLQGFPVRASASRTPARRVAAIVITASLSVTHISGAMRLCRQRRSSAFHDYPFELGER